MRQASLRFAIDRMTPPHLARAALARGPGLTGIDISYHLDGNFIAREKPAADVRLADGSIVTTIFINAFSCFNESPACKGEASKLVDCAAACGAKTPTNAIRQGHPRAGQ